MPLACSYPVLGSIFGSCLDLTAFEILHSLYHPFQVYFSPKRLYSLKFILLLTVFAIKMNSFEDLDCEISQQEAN